VGEEEAEGYFLKAIEIAHHQQAKSLELRAAMSLARLWQSQGKTAEARQRLAEIYGWLTEGCDTKDLQEAKALLDELSERGQQVLYNSHRGPLYDRNTYYALRFTYYVLCLIFDVFRNGPLRKRRSARTGCTEPAYNAERV
jgi:hypothetical protein